MKILIKQSFLLLVSMLLVTSTLAQASRNFQQIVDSGELRIGVSVFQPWVIQDKDTPLRGAEIDMAKRLSKDMRLTPKLTVYAWDALIPALLKGEIDIIVSGMAITPARALQVNFSKSYGSSGIGMAANKRLTQDFKSFESMKQAGIRLAVVSETASADVAKRVFPNAEYKWFDSVAEADKALLKGQVHALIAASPIPRFLALRYPNDVDVPLAKPLLSFKEAFAVRKGDVDWLNFLDAWIIAREADGWIASTRRYWFESLRWQEKPR